MCFLVAVRGYVLEFCANGTCIGDLWSPLVHPACESRAMITNGMSEISMGQHSELGLFLAIMISMILGVLLGLKCMKCRRMLRN